MARDSTLSPDDANKLENVHAKIAKPLADPRPSVPADVVFDRVLESIRNNGSAIESERD